MRVPATLRIESPVPGVLRITLEGHIGPDEARRMIDESTKIIEEHGSLASFCDWEKMSGYEPEVRATLTRWAARIRSQFECFHVLLKVDSPILAMAISATNLTLRGLLRVHTRRASFEAALAARLRVPPVRR